MKFFFKKKAIKKGENVEWGKRSGRGRGGGEVTFFWAHEVVEKISMEEELI